MRPRIRKVDVRLEASTNPEKNSLLCSIHSKTNKLAKPVTIGERTGMHRNAVLKTHIVSIGEFTVPSGTFRCATNKARITDKVIDKMSRKIDY